MVPELNFATIKEEHIEVWYLYLFRSLRIAFITHSARFGASAHYEYNRPGDRENRSQPISISQILVKEHIYE